MSRLSILFFSICLFLLVAIQLGCTGSTTAKPVALSAVSSPASAEEAMVVPRAEYQNWGQYPVGTVVTRVRKIGEGEEQVVQTTRYKLSEKNEKEVVIEPFVEIKSIHRDEANVMGPIEYGATFRLPKGMTEEMFSMPDPKAKSLGTEEIEALGKTYTAQVYTWNTDSNAGTVANKLWMSNEVPGRVIKHQTEVVGHKTEEALTQVDRPEDKAVSTKQ